MMVVGLLVAAMLIVYVANASLTIGSELKEARGELQLIADMTSQNIEASLLFHDKKGTQDVLQSLSANPNITAAEVTDQDNNVVVKLHHVDGAAKVGAIVQALPLPQTLSVNHAISAGNQILGTLTIHASLNEMWSALLTQLAQLAALIVAILVLGAFLIKRASRLIVEPIGRVASIANEITQRGSYALRVPSGADDEVGEMVAALNIMLSEIEQRDQELLISAVAFESQEGMLVTDANHVVLRVNRSFTQITGYSAEEVVGQKPRILQSGLHEATFYEAMWERINNKGSWQGEVWSQRKNEEVYPEWLTITAVKAKQGAVTHYVVTFVDITERKANEEKITQLAFYDSLTQLPNRRLFLERLTQRLAVGSRNNRSGALMFIDLDNFKLLNDTLGHHVGDLLLQQVGQRLVRSVREVDTVARLGGDEFVVLLDDLSDDSQAAMLHAVAVGEKIIYALNQLYQLAEHEYRSTPSIGLTLFSGNQFTLDEIIKRADTAMYQAKRAGRNNLQFFEDDI